MDAYELTMNRRNTVEYIDSDRSDIILSREERIRDASGGWRRPDAPPAPLVAQPMRFVVNTDALQARTSVDGEEVTPEYLIIALWDADVRNGDWFYKRGIKYEVVFVHPDALYELLAEVAYRG